MRIQQSAWLYMVLGLCALSVAGAQNLPLHKKAYLLHENGRFLSVSITYRDLGQKRSAMAI
jgi:hypothetical protein